MTRFRMPRRRAGDRTAEELDAAHNAAVERLVTEHAARQPEAVQSELGAPEGHPDGQAPGGEDRRGPEHTTEGEQDVQH